MKASVGDRIIIRGRNIDEKARDGEIVELLHPDGEPPYRVRWEDGHEGIFFPGPDASIHHHGALTGSTG